MIIQIDKNIKCTNPADCANEIKAAVESQYPPTNPQSYHIDIDHAPNLHRIFVCFYDKAGEVSYYDVNKNQEVKTTNGTAPTKLKFSSTPNKADIETKINSKLLTSDKVDSFTP